MGQHEVWTDGTDTPNDSDRLARIEHDVTEIKKFCESVATAVNSLGSSGGMAGMMARNMFPPEVLSMAVQRSNGSSGV